MERGDSAQRSHAKAQWSAGAPGVLGMVCTPGWSSLDLRLPGFHLPRGALEMGIPDSAPRCVSAGRRAASPLWARLPTSLEWIALAARPQHVGVEI